MNGVISRQDNRQALLFMMAIWLIPLQSMLFVGEVPYISPPTCVISAIGLLLASLGYYPRSCGLMQTSGISIRTAIYIYFFYALIHGLVIDLIRQMNGEAGVLQGEYIRQAAALLSGLLVFEYFRLMFRAWGLSRFNHTMILAFKAQISLVVIAVVGQVLGLTEMGTGIAEIRSIVIPVAGAEQNFRAAGLATEPSYFAIVLAAFFLPLSVIRSIQYGRSIEWVWLLLSIAAIFFTFSLSGYIVFVAGGVYLAFNSLKKYSLLAFVLIFFLLGLGALSLLDGNYAAMQLNSALNFTNGERSTGSLSLLDPWYSYVGPMNNYSISLAVGVGLGGTEAQINDILTADIADLFREAFGKDRVAVLLARVWVEQGLIGLILFLTIWRKAWKHIQGAAISLETKQVLKTAIIILFLSYAIKFGSFALPYMWIMFAYIAQLPTERIASTLKKEAPNLPKVQLSKA